MLSSGAMSIVIKSELTSGVLFSGEDWLRWKSENKLSVHSEIDISVEEGKDSRFGAVYVVEGRNTL